MSFFSTLRIGASALRAQRLRMDVISSNIANAETTRTSDGGPYRRQEVVFAPRGNAGSGFSFFRAMALGDVAERGELPSQGVAVTSIVRDQSPFKTVYDPGHPDANADGFVEMPNVDLVTEMTDMIAATRSYEAAVTALNAAKAMAQKALEIGR